MTPVLLITMVLAAGGPPDATPRGRAIAAARETLRQTEGLDERQIEVEDAVPMSWPDASLGCPEKGKVYAAVVTAGYRVVLSAGGRVYAVHVAEGQGVACRKSFLVARNAAADEGQSSGVEPLPEPSEPYRRKVVGQAREDLARRLSIAPDQIALVKIKDVRWPDAGMGCPRPGVAYPQVPRDGLLIGLSAGGRTYAYHSGDNRAPFLCEEPEKPAVP